MLLTPFRAYSDVLGRWISRDPLKAAEELQGPNVYQYVQNDVTNRVDPFGLYFWKCGYEPFYGFKTFRCPQTSPDCYNDHPTPCDPKPCPDEDKKKDKKGVLR